MKAINNKTSSIKELFQRLLKAVLVVTQSLPQSMCLWKVHRYIDMAKLFLEAATWAGPGRWAEDVYVYIYMYIWTYLTYIYKLYINEIQNITELYKSRS